MHQAPRQDCGLAALIVVRRKRAVLALVTIGITLSGGKQSSLRNAICPKLYSASLLLTLTFVYEVPAHSEANYV